MTPAEAREIDRLEFEAECAAIRQRAYALIGHRHRIAVSPAPQKSEQASPFNRGRVGPKSILYTHAGLTLSLAQWAERLGIQYQTLAHRIRKGWPLDRVLTAQNFKGKCQPSLIIEHDGKAMTILQWAAHLGIKPNTLWQRIARGIPNDLALCARRLGRRRSPTRSGRGVTNNMGALAETGGWSTSQETSEINFPEKINSR